MKDLNLLHVFEAIWRTHSVTLAAESLGMMQAGVSGALKRQRQEHDDTLFILVGRRMEPTPYAIQISQRLLSALSLIRETENTKVSFEPEESQRICHGLILVDPSIGDNSPERPLRHAPYA